MRRAFAEALEDAMAADTEVWLLYGDLGFGVLDRIVTRFPHRALNCGVAEQNMMGVAAGLAAEGKVVFVYSITNFAVLRCYEQLRNDVCYPNLRVKVIGVGVGEDYAGMGFTHYGIEDGDAVRLLPNIRVVEPESPEAVRRCVAEAARAPGPLYLRLRRG